MKFQFKSYFSIFQMNFFSNMGQDESVIAAPNQNYTDNMEPWVKFYEDDGDLLLAQAASYSSYQDFENAYYKEYQSTPLHHAIKSSKTEIVRKLLLKGTDINNLDYMSYTPLYYSITADSEEIVKLLLDYGAAAKGSFVENDNEVSYFERVCQSCNWKIVKLFLNYGCNANEVFINDPWSYPKYCRPLHIAVIFKRLETIKILLNYHADVNDINHNGESPLYLACARNYVEAVELLLNKNALVNVYAKDNTTPLYQGIKCGNNKIVELLLSNGAYIENENIDTVMNICDPLHVAISRGYLKILEDLLSHGLNVNMKYGVSKNEKDPAFLHTAVENEQIEIVDLLLKYNAEVNIKDGLGRTPLHIAAANESEVMIELLLQYDPYLKVSPEYSTLNAVDKEGTTPFHMACKGRSNDCVQYLLECGADINAENYRGETSLYFACEVGDLSIVQLLIMNKVSINVCTEDELTPLHIAVKNGHDRIVELLLINEAVTVCLDKNGKIPLEFAVDSWDMKNIELLLQYNPDVNNECYRKVFLSVLRTHKTFGLETIECFFKYGYIMTLEDKANYAILFDCVVNGYINIVEDLLNEGANKDAHMKGETLLHSATKHRHCEIIEMLISRKANVHAKDAFGKIPIFYAIESNDKTIVELFLNNGVDVRAYPELLHYVIIKCSNNCMDMIDILLKHGADINYCDKHGVNALHLIIQFLCKDIRAEQYSLTKLHDYIVTDTIVETVEYLLERGVNVNAMTKFGWTALHMAIVLDDNLEKLIETLLKYDADVDCKNELGNTPLHLSCQKGNFAVIAILLNFGADVNIEDASGRTPLDSVFEIKYDYQKQAEEIYTAIFINNFGDLISSYYTTRTYINFCNEAVTIFQNHIIKMRTARLYLSPKNVKYLDDKQKLFQEKCQSEVCSIKELKINNYVTVYDVLVKDVTEVARYTKNENIQMICEILDNPLRFPIYGSMIVNRLRKAVRRETFLDKAKESLNILSQYGLPDSCTENVIIYLSNEDLKNLCNILVKSDSKSNSAEQDGSAKVLLNL
ncbi:ankyrin-1 isoform X1 [Nasonia vitripennis]|uniref:Ankyrin repeat protein n=2 Tax=Nasonia vitripennis TaxID=7425 RepID=A0A7M7H4N8_NASVI|nr:ankyrin-1 isoform X1 [Nasonia vitripennis]